MLDRARGLLLGLAMGDALGTPIEGLSHPNVRTYYRGIKAYRDDEKRRDLAAGQWAADTQRARALARALAAHPRELGAAREAFAAELAALTVRRPETLGRATSAAAAAAAPLGLWAHRTGRPDADAWGRALLALVDDRPDALAAGAAQVAAVGAALAAEPDAFDGAALIRTAAEAAARAEADGGGSGAVSGRLRRLAGALHEFPLDLQDLCDGTGAAADEAFPFGLAMAARGPSLPEASLLSAVNVGGDANTLGAVCGALLGALNGAAAFPAAWHDGLEAHAEIAAEADALARPAPRGG